MKIHGDPQETKKDKGSTGFEIIWFIAGGIVSFLLSLWDHSGFGLGVILPVLFATVTINENLTTFRFENLWRQFHVSDYFGYFSFGLGTGTGIYYCTQQKWGYFVVFLIVLVLDFAINKLVVKKNSVHISEPESQESVNSK